MENMYILPLTANNANNEKEIPIYESIGNDIVYIKYTNKTYIVNTSDLCRILNKRMFQLRGDDLYPTFIYNYKKVNYLQFLYDLPLQMDENTQIQFNNNNPCDLTRNNVKVETVLKTNQIDEYPNKIVFSKGHAKQYGPDAGIVKNPIWKITENEKEILLMYCEKNTICKLCPASYAKILEFEQNINSGEKMTWFKSDNGYISGKQTKVNKMIYIHQVITGYYGHGKGTGGANSTDTMSVDHIDRDPLNNTFDNLRIATRKEQENNSRGIMEDTKRKRQTNAQDLPDGITQDMLPKYVVYYYEKQLNRDYFRIERHPKLTKHWETTKSKEVSIREKLNQAIEVIENLKNDIYPKTFAEQKGLPRYVSITVRNGKQELIYDEKINGCRFNYRQVLPENHNIARELIKLNINIHSKYPDKQLNGISLEMPEELVEQKEEDPFLQTVEEYRTKIKFIKYVKICKDKQYYTLGYDERIHQPTKIQFNVKITLNPKQPMKGINELLKELKQRLEIKYKDTYPDKIFHIPIM
jgi:hypothetical protein